MRYVFRWAAHLPGLGALGLGSAAIGVGCGLWTSEANGWAEAREVAGTYVLESINGAPATGPAGPLAGCPQPGSLGELSLGGPAADAGPLYGLEIRPAPGVAPTVRDAGDWSVRNELVRFASSPAYGRGTYTGEVHRDAEHTARVTITLGGDRFAFQRLRLWDDASAWGLIRVTSVDTAGVLAPGLLVQFRAPDGIESPGVVVYEQGFATGGPPGAWYISLTPPTGYRLAATQPERLCLTVQARAEAALRVVLEPLAP